MKGVDPPCPPSLPLNRMLPFREVARGVSAVRRRRRDDPVRYGTIPPNGPVRPSSEDRSQKDMKYSDVSSEYIRTTP